MGSRSPRAGHTGNGVAQPVVACSHVALIVESAAPVSPESPESPVDEVGLATTVEDAARVAPVLVPDDCAVAAPEFPEVARGSTLMATPPALPALAAAATMPIPPAVNVPPVTVSVTVTVC